MEAGSEIDIFLGVASRRGVVIQYTSERLLGGALDWGGGCLEIDVGTIQS
jgi:hypothetical protein